MKGFWKKLYKKIKRNFNLKNITAITALAISIVFFYKSASKKIPNVKLSYFLMALSQNMLSEIYINGGQLIFRGKNSENWYSTDATLLTKDRLYKLLICKSENINPKGNNGLAQILLFAASFYVGFQLYSSLTENLSKKNINESLNSKYRFSDVYGLDYAKEELKEIIDFLKDPLKYQTVGARLRRGVLIHGLPGTGKTLLAKATAGESNATFLYCTASEFVELYVGMGAKRARDNIPCIVFIDEIDGIGSRRKWNDGMEQAADLERSTTLNQLLTEIDGFRENENIVVIAATNRILLLDDALLRSGRFDTKIKVEMPNIEERIGIMKLHMRNKKHQVTDDIITTISKEANEFSGADLENLVNESAYLAIHNKREIIIDEDMYNSFKKIWSQRGSKVFK